MTYAAGGGAKEDPGFGHFGYLGREENTGDGNN